MKTTKFQSAICLLICFATFSVNSALAAGNHLTMSLQNCSQPTSNTIQFDLYAINDGSANGDVRANSFQIGINFNTAILQQGAKISASYVKGTTEFPKLNGFNFPVASSSDHIRIVQSAYSNGNTGVTMTPGQQYKIGTFVLTSTQNWTDGVSPDLSFQTSTVAGKTVCAAVAWIGSAPATSSVVIPGSGTVASQNAMARTGNSLPISLSTTIDCRMAKIQSGSQSVSVYPNPTSSKATVSFTSENSAAYHLVLLDAASREIMVKDGKTVQGVNAIDLDMSSVAKGVYMIALQQGENRSQQRLIVE
jgi:hypothetical protein